ncbi:MAG: hypothetical protein QOH77_940, partial [Actinomycetota bacterium]|nr:hypothetical protein [Actinomycetota bacterium]
RLAIRPTANAAIGIAAAEVAAAGIVPTAVPAAEVAA